MKSKLFFPRLHSRSLDGLNKNILTSYQSSVDMMLTGIAKTIPSEFFSAQDESQINSKLFAHIFKCQVTTRLIDYAGLALTSNKQGYYGINNMGHEGLAALAYNIKLSDPKLLHYRSGAAYVEWLERADVDPITDMLRSIVCSRYNFSGGRHKVFGNESAGVIPQTSTIASQIPKAVGLAVALEQAKALKIRGVFPEDSIIVCSFGDGSFNHGSAQEAFNMVEWLKFKRMSVPLLMICENNGVSISTKNPPGYIEAMMSHRLGFHYLKVNGLNLQDTFQKSKIGIKIARELREPVFMDIKTVRLGTHYTGDSSEINQDDPLLHSASMAIQFDFMSLDEILNTIREISARVIDTMDKVIKEPKLSKLDDLNKIVIPTTPSDRPAKEFVVSNRVSDQLNPYRLTFNISEKPLTLAQTLNRSLKESMQQNPAIVVFGDDVANNDGGVYGVTKDLEQIFGDKRIFNTSIAETSMLAIAQMMGLNGLMPIVEIRHLAYLHNAIDQLRGEASTTAWLSNGKFTSPLLLRIPGLAYNLSGGHFHNDSSIAAIRDIPGVIIACPSNPEVAASMLRSCIDMVYKDRRVVIFIEPIALYNTADLYMPGDNKYLSKYKSNDAVVQLNQIGLYGRSHCLTIISYGNGFYHSLQAAEELKKENIDVQVIDLRWLKPLAMDAICDAIKNTPNVLIVDEGRKTGSLSEELMTRLSETFRKSHNFNRITSIDTFVPLGPSAFSVFPTKQNILSFVYNHLELEKSDHGYKLKQ
jgi:2-oxoisovalerate dehydrogenase E1 component